MNRFVRPIAGISFSLLLAPALLGGCVANAETATATQPPVKWDEHVLRQDAAWYATDAAQSLADSVLAYQSAEGGFPKNTDLSVKPDPALLQSNEHGARANSFDNHATTTPIEFLAMVYRASGKEEYRKAVDLGIDYILQAQYANGGWPQFYPIRQGYYSHITFNDDAMTRVVEFLERVGAGDGPFGFIEPHRRELATQAAERGIDLILKLQIVQDGKPTVWAAQYDENTLEPAWARRYEPPSLSGSESVGIVELLMGIDDPSPEVVAAVEGAVTWFKAHSISGYRLEKFTDANGGKDARLVPDADAPLLWARFYELETNRPLFLGRDSVFRYRLEDIEQERRGGYNYYGYWANDLIEKRYPRWKAAIGRGDAL